MLGAILNHELYRYTGRSDFRSFASTFLKIPGFRYIYFLRKTQAARARKGPLAKIGFVWNKVWLKHCGAVYGIEIPELAKIDPGLYIGHSGGIIVHPEAVLGCDVCIQQGVTIGQTNRGPKAGVPVIGNRVWIGPNAVIVGRITIGDDALIGPGAYVNFDVQERAVVIGNPGKVVSYGGSAGYVVRAMSSE